MLTLAQALAAKGDEKKLIANYRRSRSAYLHSRASSHIFDRRGASSWRLNHDGEYKMRIAMLEVAAETNDTQRYVAAFCQLNNLKHEVKLP